jgi:hypothetical protein
MIRFLTTVLAGSLAAGSANVDQNKQNQSSADKSTLQSTLVSRGDPISSSLTQIMSRRCDRYNNNSGGRLILVSDPPNDGSEVKPMPPGRPDCGESAPRRVYKPAAAQCGLDKLLPVRGEFSCWMIPKVDGTGCVEQCIFVDCAPP